MVAIVVSRSVRNLTICSMLIESESATDGGLLLCYYPELGCS